MIKDLGAGIVSAWEGLRPTTRNMLVGALESPGTIQTMGQQPKFFYDVHSDWELTRLLNALDEQRTAGLPEITSEKLAEIDQLAEICVRVLRESSASAEVFLKLAERALIKHDYRQIDELGDQLDKKYSAHEIAEVIRQTGYPQIRAISYEALVMQPVRDLAALAGDPLYGDIALAALEQKAFEFENDAARDFLENYFPERDVTGN